MPNPKLLEYIQTELARGAEKQVIITSLLSEGWQQAQIDEAFASLYPQAPTPQQQISSPISNYLPGVIQILKEAWQIYKERWKTLVMISLIPIVFLPLVFLSAISLPLLGFAMGKSFFLVSVVLMTIISLFLVLLNLWAPLAQLYAIKHRDEKIGFRTSFGRSRGRVLLYIILSLAFFVTVTLGYILFIVPGIIFGTWFSLATYVFVAENTSLIAAFKKSKEYVNGKFFAVLYRLIGIGFLIGVINFILVLIPFVNIFAFPIYSLITLPLMTISYFVLYENLKNLSGKPISNPPSKLFISPILFLLALIVFLLFVVLAYVVPNLIKSYSKPPASYQYQQTLPNSNLNASPTQAPTTTPTLITAPIQASESAQTPFCTVDWSQLPSSMVRPYYFIATFSSNFGTTMPSIYLNPGGQTVYRKNNPSNSSPIFSTGIELPFQMPGVYTLKPYLDDSTGKGIECNEKTYSVVAGPTLPPTQ